MADQINYTGTIDKQNLIFGLDAFQEFNTYYSANTATTSKTYLSEKSSYPISCTVKTKPGTVRNSRWHSIIGTDDPKNPGPEPIEVSCENTAQHMGFESPYLINTKPVYFYDPDGNIQFKITVFKKTFLKAWPAFKIANNVDNTKEFTNKDGNDNNGISYKTSSTKEGYDSREIIISLPAKHFVPIGTNTSVSFTLYYIATGKENIKVDVVRVWEKECEFDSNKNEDGKSFTFGPEQTNTFINAGGIDGLFKYRWSNYAYKTTVKCKYAGPDNDNSRENKFEVENINFGTGKSMEVVVSGAGSNVRLRSIIITANDTKENCPLTFSFIAARYRTKSDTTKKFTMCVTFEYQYYGSNDWGSKTDTVNSSGPAHDHVLKPNNSLSSQQYQHI